MVQVSPSAAGVGLSLPMISASLCMQQIQQQEHLHQQQLHSLSSLLLSSQCSMAPPSPFAFGALPEAAARF